MKVLAIALMILCFSSPIAFADGDGGDLAVDVRVETNAP